MKNRLVCCIILLVQIYSCIENDKNLKKQNNYIENTDEKSRRLESFLNSPVSLNSIDDKYQVGDKFFKKSYLLVENEHYFFNKKPKNDSLVKLSFNDNILILQKNQFSEHILHLKVNSAEIKMNNGIYVGMPLDSFKLLLPLEIDKNFEALYISDEYYELKFSFDSKTKKLKEINYNSFLD